MNRQNNFNMRKHNDCFTCINRCINNNTKNFDIQCDDNIAIVNVNDFFYYIDIDFFRFHKIIFDEHVDFQIINQMNFTRNHNFDDNFVFFVRKINENYDVIVKSILCRIEITNWNWCCYCSNRYIRCLFFEKFAIDENDIDVNIETNMFQFDNEWQYYENTNVFLFSKFIIDVNVFIEIDVWKYNRKKNCNFFFNIIVIKNEICEKLFDKIDNFDYDKRILDNLNKKKLFQI